MENLNNEIQSIYLFPQNNHTYGATVSTEAPTIDGAVKLTDIRNFPVDVTYTRTDLNGSLCYELDHCANLDDLLSSLDWCGRCRYTIHTIWGFDLQQTKEQSLIDLFYQARQYRLSIIAQEMDQLTEEHEDPSPTLLANKINEAECCVSPSATGNIQVRPEPVR